MKHKLNTNNIDDLIYLEGSNIENITSTILNEITTSFKLKLNQHKQLIEKNKELFIYDYRSPLIDFNNPNWKKSPVLLDNPAIQPHDSKINSIDITPTQFKITGSGHSYMNYQNYNFDLMFSDLNNFSIKESKYSHFKKDSSSSLSIEEFNSKLSLLSFREVFLEENKLNSSINFIFIDYSNENINEEKRDIIVINFDFESVKVNCDLKQVKNKKLKK